LFPRLTCVGLYHGRSAAPNPCGSYPLETQVSRQVEHESEASTERVLFESSGRQYDSKGHQTGQ
jgi:hypothetical protein